MSDIKTTREIYKKLPQKMREIIVSPELIEVVSSISNNNNLNDRQHQVVAEAVVGFLMGASSKDSIKTTITNSVDNDNTRGQKIFSDIEKKILNNLDNIYRKISENINTGTDYEIKEQQEEKPKEETAVQQERQSSVGQSFEQIILNQAKAMQPARPKDETGGIANNEYGIMEEKKEPPINLPTGEAPKPVHDYKEGGDPYREPLE